MEKNTYKSYSMSTHEFSNAVKNNQFNEVEEYIHYHSKRGQSFGNLFTVIFSCHKFQDYKYLLSSSEFDVNDYEILHLCVRHEISDLIHFLDYKTEKNEVFSVTEIKHFIKEASSFLAYSHIDYILNYYNLKNEDLFNAAFFETYLSFVLGMSNQLNLNKNIGLKKFLINYSSKINNKNLSIDHQLAYNKIKNRDSSYYIQEIWDIINMSNNLKNF